VIELCIFRSTNSANELRRKYRSPFTYAKLRDEWGWELFAAATLKQRTALKAMATSGKRIWIEITVQHTRLFDRDNLWSSVKPLLDSMVQLRWLAGDSEKHIDLLVVQSAGKPDKTRIRLEVMR
jgi:hypothetical protein